MTMNLIETLKTSIYRPKHTKNTKIHVIFHFKKHIFKKFKCQRFMLFSIALFILLRATHPN